MGQNAIDCSGTASQVSWFDAINYCHGLSLAAKVWRLPSINELNSIIDLSKVNPTIDSTVFPSTVSLPYSSSTTTAFDTDMAFDLFFNNGLLLYNWKPQNVDYVRCVADP